MSDKNPAPEAADGHPRPEGLQDLEQVRADVLKTLREIYDPEIPVNIHDIGLIYNIDITGDAHVEIRMTLTSPQCPVAEALPAEVEQKVAATKGVNGATVHVVWEPTWTPDMMSEEAKLELNMF